MSKVKIDGRGAGFPMPVALVAYDSAGKANFETVSWVARVNGDPPMIAFAPGCRGGYEIPGIVRSGSFSVNLPGIDLMDTADYCALNPGEDVDKSALFDTFRGERTGAPMIGQCPVCMECRLVQSLALPSHTLYIGEIVGFYAEESCLASGSPDPSLWHPFVLTRPDDAYWEVGARAGHAWAVGDECSSCRRLAKQERLAPPEKRLEDTWPGTEPLEDTRPGALLLEEQQPGKTWLERYGEPLASTKEWAAAFMEAELERAVPDGWKVQPVRGEPLAWTIVPAAEGSGGGADVDYGIRVTAGLDQVLFTFENNDIGPLDLHQALLNAMVIDAAALRHYGVAACLREVMSRHRPNRWGYT